CIVIVTDRTQANLRWASSTLTTNGVLQQRSVTVIAFINTGNSMSSGAVTRTNVEESDIDSLLQQAIAAAKAAGAAEDYAPIAKDLSVGNWQAPHQPTGAEVFKKFAPDLGQIMSKSVSDAIELFGFAEHTHETVWVGSKGGLRLRSDKPVGRVEMTAKSHGRTRSTWFGVETHDFSDVSVASIDKDIRQRLTWQERKVELPAGRYDTLLPSGSVADFYVYMMWMAGARDAFEGQSVFSKKGGGTRVGEKLSNVGLQLFSDPNHSQLKGAQLVYAAASSPFTSVFDNGQLQKRSDWIKDGVLQALLQTRATSKLTSLAYTPMGENLIMSVNDGAGSTMDLVKQVDHGLLVTTLWYIRMVDPNTLLLTGLTRDGVYYVKNGEVQGVTNNFRWNDSPVSALSRIKAAGATEWTQPREWAGDVTSMAVPALVIKDFNMSTVSPGN
ncbi:MAG: metallopeptidase TldD-related protein, partial [Candidatus Nanopelagicus sp.]